MSDRQDNQHQGKDSHSGWLMHCGGGEYRPGADRGWQAEVLELLGARIEDPRSAA